MSVLEEAPLALMDDRCNPSRPLCVGHSHSTDPLRRGGQSCPNASRTLSPALDDDPRPSAVGNLARRND